MAVRKAGISVKLMVLLLTLIGSEAVSPPANPIIFSRPRIPESHIATFKTLLGTVKGSQRVLVIGEDQGHVVARLAHSGLSLYWMTITRGHDKAFHKPMSAVILSDMLGETNALAWSVSKTLEAGGLLFVPESMLMLDYYLHVYGMERTGLKMKRFLDGDYFVIYQKGNGNGKHRIQEAA